MLNSFVPAVTTPAVVPLALALYNSVGNLGGIIGPWLIGVLVERTGGYGLSMQVLGVVMCTAAAMAYGTRGWDASLLREASGSAPPAPRLSPPRESSGGRATIEMQGLIAHPAKD